MNTLLVRRNVNPLAQSFAINKAMDRMVRDAFGSGLRSPAYAPALDIVETESAYTIKAALPGWQPEQVDIAFEDGVVTLKGEIAAEVESAEKVETEKLHLREIHQENFVRRISLPLDVDADNASAAFANGLLTLTIPKAEVVKPKQIKIVAK